ncbi:unnamed protein product [Effrenium voratum]|nr:unnamed protein product [Effrenium voratum]|mmetsp:Transcript_6382/g.15020  ORF Transcript_6382/g.15020 Transcript_6382/m.15020 type:complete len:817 (+) Transcript_6382:144-2594(+)|eukprot:CAMPEP_0181430566 /NCGR_PEP_ID=MMETSP1110-20121109/17789_1 /TAXON_ID=174948 /ORGANISM="Symbiodinium sp., Strain CCMP421" /LENGTH=816 /DNA_ID=CAMNT_0023553885 /DNA_START=144 /DNA_END=2594 /DNA_ORIENTATION=-
MSKILESALKNPRQRNLDDDIRLMAGSMLTYSSLMNNNQEGMETQAVTIVARQQRSKLLGCLMLPLAFMYFILFSASIMLHEDISDVYMIESEMRSQMDDIFSEVESIDGLWDALQGPFAEVFFKQTDMYNRPLAKSTSNENWGDWGRVNVYHQIQGAVRFQQTRRNARNFGKQFVCNSVISCFLCRSNRGFQPAANAPAGAEVASIDCGSWAPTRRLANETQEMDRRLSLMQPPLLSSLPKESEDEINIFRMYMYPGESMAESSERLQYFRTRNWLDEDSQVLALRLYMLNSELGQPNLEQVTLKFFFSDGGSVFYTRDFQAIFFDVFPNSLSMVVDGFFFLILCFTGVLQVIVMWRMLRDRKVVTYIADIRTLLELVVIAGGIFFCYQFYAVYRTKGLMTDIMTDIRGYGWNIRDANQAVIEKLFDTGANAADDILSLRLLAANYTLILTFRFFVNFQAQPQLAIIIKTLGSLMVEIIHFIVVFIPTILIYVTSATLLFGRRIEDVSTFWGSLGYIFRMAQEGEYDWDGLQAENYWSSALWIWSFVVFVNMLLINLLIAIILDTYKEVQKAQVSREAVWNTLGQFWHRLVYLRRWVSELEISNKCSEKYHPDLLEKETLKEFFPNMPQCQVDLVFSDSADQMKIQSNKDIHTQNLLKMAGSLMDSVSAVNRALHTVNTEESQDSLQSWMVGKKVPSALSASKVATQGGTVPLVHKGSQPPRLVDPFKVDEEEGEEVPEGEKLENNVETEVNELNAETKVETEEISEEEWRPLWQRELDGMLKAQRGWLLNAGWHLEQLNAVLRQRAKQLGASAR